MFCRKSLGCDEGIGIKGSDLRSLEERSLLVVRETCEQLWLQAFQQKLRLGESHVVRSTLYRSGSSNPELFRRTDCDRVFRFLQERLKARHQILVAARTAIASSTVRAASAGSMTRTAIPEAARTESARFAARLRCCGAGEWRAFRVGDNIAAQSFTAAGSLNVFESLQREMEHAAFRELIG